MFYIATLMGELGLILNSSPEIACIAQFGRGIIKCVARMGAYESPFNFIKKLSFF